MDEQALTKIRLVLMDIDGTLVHGDSNTIENVVRQLYRLRRLGVRFSLATGRTLSGASTILQEILGVRTRQRPPIIAYNGGVIASPDLQVIHRFSISPAIVRDLLDVCIQFSVVAVVYRCELSFSNRAIESAVGGSDHFKSGEREFNGMEVTVVKHLYDVPSEDCISILAEGGDLPNLGRVLRSQFGNRLRITSSGNRFLEIASSSSTKMEGVLSLAHWLRLETSAIMAIGDSYNDIDMLKGVGIGVAVANAPAEVKSAAKYVCRRAAAEGVVEILRSLVETTNRQRVFDRLGIAKG